MIRKYLLAVGLAFACVISSEAQTWTTANIPQGNWWSPVYSTNGDKAYAVSLYYGVYASTNYGLDWARTSAPQTNWTSVTCSADGSEVVATVSQNQNIFPWISIPGPIYISRDSGLTWTVANAPLANWSSVACSADGKTLLASAGDGFNDGPLYVSTDSGVTWTPSDLTTTRWDAVAMSSDGELMYAKRDFGGTLVSTNRGVTWEPGTAPSNFFGLSSSSADGMHQVAFQVCGSLLTSDDGGTNWTIVPDSTGLWQAVAASPNGTWRLAVDGGAGARVSYVPESAPFFVRQPIAATNLVETTVVTLKAAALGSGPMVYQWQHDGTNLIDDARITGSTNTELTITNLIVGDSGSYTLVASNYLGLTNSEAAMVTVKADDQKPVVQIYSPSPSDNLVGLGFSAAGGASDNSHVVGVWYRLNSGPWSAAHTANNWQDWGANFSPTNGVNVFSAFAVDALGNVSITNSVTFKAEIKGQLYVIVNGQGKVRPPQAVQYFPLGSICKLTAIPNHGYIFSGWTILPSTNASISFALTNDMEVQANFVSNPFLSVKGKYKAPVTVFSQLPDLRPSVVEAQVMKNGSFVLNLNLGGKRYHYSGKFAVDGTAAFTLNKKGTSPISVSLQLDMLAVSNTLRADIAGFDFTALGIAAKKGE